jgi:hypothetical protein
MEGRFMNMYLAPVPAKVPPKPRAPRVPKPETSDGQAPAGDDTAMAAALIAAGANNDGGSDAAPAEQQG